MPNSTTNNSVSSAIERMVVGTPISLLKLAGVLTVLKVLAPIAAIKSFVVVFPFEPEMATIFGAIFFR